MPFQAIWMQPEPLAAEAVSQRQRGGFSSSCVLWCADYKGQFKTKDSKYRFPLTVTDALGLLTVVFVVGKVGYYA